MSAVDVLQNLASKAARRVGALHKPLVRYSRRRARRAEHQSYAEESAALDRQIASIAGAGSPIVVGPWLAEVGYEVLYWIPFVRWFCDAHGIARDRLIVVSRGGIAPLYRDLAAQYVDLFELRTPQQLTAANERRRATHEDGGQKQSGLSTLDEELVAAVRARIGAPSVQVLHPSLMFRLFRQVWHDNLPYDVLWRHTRYTSLIFNERTLDGLPEQYVALKLYSGPALSLDDECVEAVRRLVAGIASQIPVVALETTLGLDEHRDVDLTDIPGVVSARQMMSAGNNLAVQLELISRSRYFVSSCGGLAWLAPFLGTPTIAVYDNDALLAPHLFVARQAGRRAGAAAFAPLDLNGMVGILNANFT